MRFKLLLSLFIFINFNLLCVHALSIDPDETWDKSSLITEIGRPKRESISFLTGGRSQRRVPRRAGVGPLKANNSNKGLLVHGTISWQAVDGQKYSINYEADENGVRGLNGV